MATTRLPAADYLPRTFYAVALLFRHPDAGYMPVLHHFGVAGRDPLTEDEAVARSLKETEANWNDAPQPAAFAALTLVSALVSPLVIREAS